MKRLSPRASGQSQRPLAIAKRTVGLVLVGVLLLVLVAGAALAVGRASLGAAMDQRLADRSAMVSSFHRSNDPRSGDDAFRERLDGIGFSPTDLVFNADFLASLVATRNGDPVITSQIVRNDDVLVGSFPADAELPLDDMAEAIDAARGGDVGISRVFELDGSLAWAKTYPLGGEERWGVVVLVEPLTGANTQELYDGLGTLGTGRGGMTLLDADGVAVYSWDRSLVGTEPYTDAERARLSGEPRDWRAVVAGEEIVRIGVTDVDRSDALSLVFEQPEADLFGDLRDAQRQRDLLVISLAVLAMAVVGVFTAVRQRAVRRSEARIERIMRNTHDVVLVVDDEGTLSFVSPAAELMLDQDPTDWVGRPLAELVDDAHVERVGTAIGDARRDGTASLLGVRLHAGHGRLRWFDLALTSRPHPDVPGILVTCQEVGGRKELEDQLAYEAGHDALTGLANRAQFEAALHEVCRRRGSLAVMLIDLDRFKQLNDTLGHDAGDIALRGVSDCLRSAMRAGDVVGRLGGDEFAVVVPGATAEVAQSMAARIGSAVRSVCPSLGDQPGLDASIGIAVTEGPVAAPELIVRDADAAMYEAKRAGGGRAVCVTVAPTGDDAGDADPAVPAPDVPRSAPVPSRRSTDDPTAPVAAASSAPAPVPSPLTAAPVGSGPGTSIVGHLRSAAVLVLTAAIVVGAAGVGVAESGRAQAAAEQRRLDERSSLLRSLASVTASRSDPARLTPIVQTAPWMLDDVEFTELVLSAFAGAPPLGRNGVAAALRPDGSLIAVSPSGTHVPVDTSDQAWTGVLRGQAYIPDLLHDGELFRSYQFVPKMGADGTAEMVVAIGMDTRDSDWSSVYEALGALGDGLGGTSTVDSNGVAAASWDDEQVGRPVVDPAMLEGLVPGEVVEHRRYVDGEEQVTLAIRTPMAHIERYVVWQQSATGLFGDLRSGQGVRDVAVFGLLVVAVLALAVVNRRRELALRRNASRLDTLLRHTHDLVIVADSERRIRFASAAVEGLFGLTAGDVVDRPLDALIGLVPARAVLEATRTATLAEGRRCSVDDLVVAGPDGDLHFDVDGANLLDVDGVDGYLLTFHEVSERKALQERLSDQATHDPLTGLANRAAFATRLDELATTSDHPSHHAVVFVDLDHFKPVNDEFGHQAGDELLCTVARRLTAVVRSGDLVCRLGGDEFAILLADCTEEQARVTVERLLHAVREPVPVADVLVSVDASIGVALSRSTVAHPEQLVREADQAMYQAKRSGRGRFVIGV